MNAVVTTIPQPAEDSRSLVQVIERAATNPEVDIDKMERLLQMHERITERQARAAYAAALARLQPRLPIIAERGGIKDRGGNIQSKYALWEDIVGVITPILSEEGFSLSFRTGNDANGVTVTGVLMHRDGHAESTSLTLPIDTSGSKNGVQSVGSSTSYGKRYTAAALLNLRTGDVDDDGQAGPGGCITEAQAADLRALAEEVGADQGRFLKYLGAASIDTIPAAKFPAAVKALEAKRSKA
jgi:hypothetical protein